MFYLGIAIAAVLGLTLLVSLDAGSMIGLSQGQTAAVIPLVVLLAVFARGLAGRGGQLGQTAGNAILWIGIFGAVMVGYAYRDDLSGVAARVFGELVPGAAIIDRDGGTATYRRGPGGHFVVTAEINGTSLPLLFDTGATAVVLTNEDARAVGIDTAALDFRIRVSTANGTGRAAPVTLDEMVVGGIVRNRVRAFIAEPGALEVSLLGMTFLETLAQYTVTSNSLELRG